MHLHLKVKDLPKKEELLGWGKRKRNSHIILTKPESSLGSGDLEWARRCWFYLNKSVFELLWAPENKQSRAWLQGWVQPGLVQCPAGAGGLRSCSFPTWKQTNGKPGAFQPSPCKTLTLWMRRERHSNSVDPQRCSGFILQKWTLSGSDWNALVSYFWFSFSSLSFISEQ